MKAFKIISSVFLVATIVVSCTTTNNGRYGDNGRVYRSPDGSVYREGQIYRDRNGNTYKNGRVYQYGTYGKQARKLPPGQAKKVYGGHAKDYAYGQTKKRDGYYKDDRHWDHDHKDHKKSKAKKHHHKGKK